MAEKKRHIPLLVCIWILLVLLAGGGVTLLYRYFPQHRSFAYDATDEVLSVPYSGLAPDGREEDLCENTSLVYVEVTLKEIEPEEGVFDFSGIEESYQIQKWKEMGKHMVLRLVLDDPSDTAHRDIPDWLYEQTGDGTDYNNEYGQGYCPDYSNPVLIAAHKEAVAALAEWAEADDFAAYVEIGSLGHWGEWHILSTDESLPAFPDESIQQQYVFAYTEAFQSAKLLMRRPFSVLPGGAGLYNDMTGDAEETNEWLSWIAEGGTFDQTGEALLAVPDIWDEAPVGGEFTSGTSMSEMLGDSYATTRQLNTDSHMSFIGPMVPVESELREDEKVNLDDLLTCIGPRYRVSALKVSGNRVSSAVELTLTNDGVCPVYFEDEKLVLYVTDQDGTTKRYVTDLDLTAMTQNASDTGSITFSMSYEELCSCTLQAAIEEGEGQERMPLFMDTQRTDNLSFLCTPSDF